jgi:hypothetical protein
MLAYPVRVQRRSYRGSNDRIKQVQIAELNRVAGVLEDYLNKQIGLNLYSRSLSEYSSSQSPLILCKIKEKQGVNP